jgi:hypothetical protein
MKIVGRRRIIDTTNNTIVIIQDFWNGKIGFEHLAESEITLKYRDDEKLEDKLLLARPSEYLVFKINNILNVGNDTVKRRVVGVEKWKKNL